MRNSCLLLILALVSCAPDSTSLVAEGEEFLADVTPAGMNIVTARSVLAEHDVEFADVPIEHCESIFLEPRFKCAGGPAIWATLNDSTNPWNPFYSPSLNAFMAFDRNNELVSTIVALQGGDR